ncbi:serine/threonine-protein kinase [Polyangium jinanense]|uniref:Serine/threonine protein kinase n=1 Tax=Polyangium jinanense TaxID=2829994 RepID=A0A9X4AWF4_9BACT|nr:serine/threonine-protein kinase [Polyangium jinanense]MDC3960491.1 serine/threonine protein kinase [Polyangium jinanense]MDC3986736.1 serine/threonine protein kinase [Polyangium jinanense]
MKAGSTIGKKYRLVRAIGAGTMGTVWAAEEIGTRREVALKLLSKSTPELRQRFLREVRLSSRLSHPNIVRLLDAGETDDGEPFLVLELLSGESLADMLKSKRRIEPPVAARIARDIANALEAAHQAKIMHRDLKPANVFLHHEPGAAEGAFVVKVLDFGIAKNLGPGEETQATMTGMVVGSPGYMSPEQVALRADVDHRTDLWSLGILLYELLAGVRPFTGSVQDVVRQVLVAPIPPLSARVRDVPQELEDVVMRCLERDRDKRIANAAELVALLTPLLESSRIWRVPSSAAIPVARASQSSSPLLVASDATPEGTAFLQPNTPAPDPLPPWRREMQESLSAHRRSGALTAGIPLPPAEATAPPITRDETATSSTTIHRRRQGRAILVLSFGLGAAAMLALVALVAVIGLPGNEPAAPTVEPSVAAAPEAASAKQAQEHAPTPKTTPSPPPPPQAPTATQEPTAMAMPALTVAPPPSSTLVVASAKAAPTYTPLPPCTLTLRVGCRNVSKPPGRKFAPSGL